MYSTSSCKFSVTLSCRNIDGTSRLIQDLEIECYTGEHLYWAVVGGGFGLVLWVVGIPWVAWALLR